LLWVGIDLHRSRSHVAVLDDQGTELISRRIVNDPVTFLGLLAEIDGESKIALEATYGWEWLADLLEGRRLRAAPRASAQDQGDRLGAGEDRRRRREDARSPACAPTSCPRPTSRRASCGSCVTCCATGWR
jgi:hypothetical protein